MAGFDQVVHRLLDRGQLDIRRTVGVSFAVEPAGILIEMTDGDVVPEPHTQTRSERLELIENGPVALLGRLARTARYWAAADVVAVDLNTICQGQTVVDNIVQNGGIGQVSFNGLDQIQFPYGVQGLALILGPQRVTAGAWVVTSSVRIPHAVRADRAAS